MQSRKALYLVTEVAPSGGGYFYALLEVRMFEK
jgi:hypothetical protein